MFDQLRPAETTETAMPCVPLCVPGSGVLANCMMAVLNARIMSNSLPHEAGGMNAVFFDECQGGVAPKSLAETRLGGLGCRYKTNVKQFNIDSARAGTEVAFGTRDVAEFIRYTCQERLVVRRSLRKSMSRLCNLTL